MEPIINPWVFYVIDLLAGIKAAVWVVMIGCVGTFMYFAINYEMYDATEAKKTKCVKVCTWAAVMFVLFGSAQIVIPDKTTCYQMLAASYVTADNIQTVQNNVVEFVVKIADGLAKVKK